MNIAEAKIPGVLVVDPCFTVESRGFMLETWNERRFVAEGINTRFVQDTLEFTYQGYLVGLHYRRIVPQGKLVYAVRGEVFYVAVDLRRESETFGDWFGMKLSGPNMKQLYIPAGFAHGYLITSLTALLICRCTEPNSPEDIAGIAWNDPDIGIAWPEANPKLSTKDKALPRLRDISNKDLPQETREELRCFG